MKVPPLINRNVPSLSWKTEGFLLQIKWTCYCLPLLCLDNYEKLGDYTNFPNWILPVTDNHPQSRFDLQNHLKLLRGKIPIEIKGEGK